MTPVLVFTVLAAMVQQPAPTPGTPRDTLSRGTQLLHAANGQIAAHNLDSAGKLLRRVAEVSDHAVAERVRAWVLLGVVSFYTTGDSAVAFAFRQALTLDPALEAALEQFDPALAQILAAERAAISAQPPGVLVAPVTPVYDCQRKCAEGVRPPHFTYFPDIQAPLDASVSLQERRMRTNLTFQAVISADGLIERETLVLLSGTARGTEQEMRRGLLQSRFAPGRANGVPVRTRVLLRFNFEAEGSSWVSFTYQVMAR